MALYSEKVLANSPALYWKLDDASGLPQDSSPNARHADTATSIVYRQAGVGALLGAEGTYAVLDDASGDVISRATMTGLDAATNWSVEGWIYKTTDADGIFWAIGNSVLGATGWRLQYDAADNKLRAVSASTGSMAAESDAGISLNTWYHVVVTRTAAPLWKMYVNGVVQASAEVDAMTAPDTGIGLYQAVNSAVLQGEGKQAHFAIYQTVLSGADILSHSQGGAGAVGGLAGLLLPCAIC